MLQRVRRTNEKEKRGARHFISRGVVAQTVQHHSRGAQYRPVGGIVRLAAGGNSIASETQLHNKAYMVYRGKGHPTKSEGLPKRWMGMTVFYLPPAEPDAVQSCYLDTPAGLVAADLTEEERDHVEAVYAEWRWGPHETYLLRMKGNQKELDPRHFDAKGKTAFDKADHLEWLQWILNGSVRVATREEEQAATTRNVIFAPMRYVRTTRPRSPIFWRRSRGWWFQVTSTRRSGVTGRTLLRRVGSPPWWPLSWAGVEACGARRSTLARHS